jgi:carboxyl-terminal processing protease
MFPLLPALLLLSGAPAADDISEQVKKFTEVYAVVEREAADPVVPAKAIYDGAIPGMLRRLDPHSIFFDPDQFQQLKHLETSTEKGFGSIVSLLPGRVIVLQTLPGTPSAKAGLAAGDEVLAVNGIALARFDIEQLAELLSQLRQKPVRLDVRRSGQSQLLEFTMTPAELQAPSVERAFLLRPGVGYVRVSSFDAQAGAQIKAAIDKIGGPELKGLVLDLRNNPGGLLPAALETVSLFLQSGQKLMSVRGRTVAVRDDVVPANNAPYDFPLAVLLNHKSASASEIVAGALQDHDRAIVVGERSFGKGLVQSIYPLSQNTGLALTTAFYYTPSGRSIQRPIEAGQIRLSDITGPDSRETAFRTDSGRPVLGGGGIQPDYAAFPGDMTRFRAALESSGAFPSFATEYVRQRGALSASFDVTPDVLDDFHVFLSDRRITPNVGEWAEEREWIRSRLKEEIFNQTLGVERGDEVEAQRDPVILTALDHLDARLASSRLLKKAISPPNDR